MRPYIAIVTASVAACSEAPEPGPSAVSGRQAERPAGDLFGEWQVAALDSPNFDASSPQFGDPRRVAMLIGVRGIEAASQCVPYLFEHRRMGEQRIEVSGIGRPEGGCARGLRPYEEVFAGLVEGVTRIDQPAPGRIRLSGPAGTLQLRRPDGGAVANPFGHTSGFGPALRWGHFRVVEAGGIEPPPERPIDVALGRSWIEARSGCLAFRWAMPRSGPAFALWREQVTGESCREEGGASELALERAMPAVRSLELIAPYRMRLSGPSGSVTLVRVRAGGQPAG